ncbi:hypothetical protein [Paenibacillus sp. MBLB4367]|uniref:hypothetical protein n=1 Tax=Paenibacillus sp. MBLB4367 TaxID=3384767 RepID=UPI0039083555
MNTISQIMQSIVSQMQASEPKSLELKVGQIVKGLVLELLAENEALVNIGGVHVRARLEMPLRQGDSALLQVQPESEGGQVVLKPLQSSGVQIAEQSLGDLLKSVGLKDTPANRQLVQQMHQESVPLTKEAARTLSETMAKAPQQSQAEWQQAAFVAVKRGLPVTEQTVGSLHQAIFGKPAAAQAGDLARELSALLARESAPKPGAAPLSAQAAGVLQQAKQQLDALLGLLAQRPGGAAAQAPASAQPQAAATPAQAPAAPQAAASAPPASVPAGSAATAAAPGLAQPAAAAPLPQAPAAQPAAGAATPAPRAAGEAAAPPAAGASPAAAAAASGGAAQPAAAAAPEPALAAKRDAAPPAAAAHAAEPAEPAAAETPWLGKLLKALGVEHESRFAKQLASGGLEPPQSELAAVLSGSADGDEGSKPLADTLKGALMQLSSLDEAPPALKEAAQQLVQQITGQQLLLTPDRGSMFAHVTMMVPLLNGNGEQAAAVHIQSRKGRNGEIDANNCRLIFDLHMKTIGNTMLDVQVFNRIVSLNVHNDLPFLNELLESNRDEIAAGLERIGYQFLSLRCSPYPQKLAVEAQDQTRTAEDGRTALASLYNARPYKSMDIRV